MSARVRADDDFFAAPSYRLGVGLSLCLALALLFPPLLLAKESAAAASDTAAASLTLDENAKMLERVVANFRL